jgi:very-short-patch-repair endonuclease
VEVGEVLSRQGVIARRDHPELARTMAALVARGDLVPVLPGIYAPADRAATVQTRIRAAMLWDPDSVLTGAAAAAVSFWPNVPLRVVEVAGRRQQTVRRAGFDWSRRRIPAELVRARGPLRYTDPALTALDLCERHGGDGIDAALRTRAASLDGMHEALRLTRHRGGNSGRRVLLLESRDEPWSAAERRFHVLLREAGITGWRANVPVPGPAGRYLLDVAFESARVAAEVDGRLHHTDPAAFEADRHRQNWLVLQGWLVLRFTWLMITEQPSEVVATVRAALGRPAPWIR